MKPPIDDFIAVYTQWDRAVINDVPTASVVFDSFCLFMEHRLLNEQKQVNLGFAKISAVAARKTWELAAYDHYRKTIKKKDSAKWKAENGTMEKYLCKILAHESMTAWDMEKEIFRWTLNIVPTESFKSNCEALEQERKKSLKFLYFYVRAVEDQLKRQLPVMYEVFVHFLKEARHPVLVFPTSAPLGGTRLKSAKEAERLRELANKYTYRPVAKTCDVSSVRGVVFGGSVESRVNKVVATEDEGVRPLPNFRQGDKDVRHCRINVGESDDRNGGASGLQVLYATEGEDGLPLLDQRPNSGSDGLAGIVEPAAEETKA